MVRSRWVDTEQSRWTGHEPLIRCTKVRRLAAHPFSLLSRITWQQAWVGILITLGDIIALDLFSCGKFRGISGKQVLSVQCDQDGDLGKYLNCYLKKGVKISDWDELSPERFEFISSCDQQQSTCTYTTHPFEPIYIGNLLPRYVWKPPRSQLAVTSLLLSRTRFRLHGGNIISWSYWRSKYWLIPTGLSITQQLVRLTIREELSRKSPGTLKLSS